MQPEHVVTHALLATSQTWLALHVVVPATQRSRASSQVSTPLHATPSPHVRGEPAHARAEHTSLSVQNIPSSQLAPSFALHAVRVVVARHTSHEFVGLTWPSP